MARTAGLGQHIRAEGPASHQKKRGTPTMGGIVFILGTLMALGVAHAVSDTRLSIEESLVVGLMLSYGLIGFLDDYLKVRRARNLGLRARQKLAMQILMASAFVWFFVEESWVVIPFSGYRLELGVLYPVLSVLLIVGMGNGVNLTDGLDGLASGVVAVGLLGYSVVARQSAAVFGVDVTLVALGGAGSVLGFLVHNRHPARVFMGDVGSLALGGLLSGLAIATKAETLLIFFAAIPIIEDLSVMLQVASFKITGKRILKMSPLHHHFELSGWRETAIVRVFWLAAFLFAVMGLVAMAWV